MVQDAKIVAAFYARFALKISEEKLRAEFSLPEDALVHKAPSMTTRKLWLGQLVTETVMDAYLSCRSYIDGGSAGSTTIPIHELYRYLKNKIKGSTKTNKPRAQYNNNYAIYRFSDIVCIIDGCTITRRDYIDLYRLHALK